MVLSSVCPKTLGSQKQSNIRQVKGLLAASQSGSGFLVRVIKLRDGNLGLESSLVEVMVIELAHLAAFVLGPLEKLILAILKGSFIK